MLVLLALRNTDADIEFEIRVAVSSFPTVLLTDERPMQFDITFVLLTWSLLSVLILINEHYWMGQFHVVSIVIFLFSIVAVTIALISMKKQRLCASRLLTVFLTLNAIGLVFYCGLYVHFLSSPDLFFKKLNVICDKAVSNCDRKPDNMMMQIILNHYLVFELMITVLSVGLIVYALIKIFTNRKWYKGGKVQETPQPHTEVDSSPTDSNEVKEIVADIEARGAKEVPVPSPETKAEWLCASLIN